MKNSAFIVIIISTIGLFSAGCKNKSVSNDINFSAIEQQIWDDPQRSIAYLNQTDHLNWDTEHQMQWHLLQELAATRLDQDVLPDSVMQEVSHYFTKKGNKELAARAYYVQGISYLKKGQYFESMQALKECENLKDYLPDSLPYVYLLYFAQGQVAETEYLSHIAYDCYLKALPYIEQAKDSLRLAFCYYNMARTRSEYPDSITHAYYQKALNIAAALSNTILYYDIKIQEEGHYREVDSMAIYTYSLYLTDSMHVPYYAHNAVEYLQNHGKIEEAQYYLDIFAQNKRNAGWSKNRLQYLTSRQKHLTCAYEEGFKQMEGLYNDQIRQLYLDGKARTYTISRMYDLEAEKNKTHQLTIVRQRLWIGISFTLVLLLVCAMVFGYFFYVQKQQLKIHNQTYALEKLSAQAAMDKINMEKQHMQEEMEKRRIQVLESLKERVRMSKLFYRSASSHTHYPKWFDDWMLQNGIIEGKNVKDVLLQFQELYPQLFKHLKEEYPLLTDKDMEYIALFVMGFDVNDICYIVGHIERTVWNRRYSIKKSILEADVDFDEWIKSLRRIDVSGIDGN